MVPYNIGYVCLLNCAVYTNHVEESLITGSELRPLLHRKHSVKLHCNDDCIYHLVLCITRMHIASLDMDLCTGSIEILVLKLSNLSAVHCIGILCTKLLHIKLVHATSNLLVGSKTNLNLSVLELRVLHNVLHCSHNLCNTGLVICTKKGCSVGCNQSLANILPYLREICHRQSDSKRGIQHNVLTVIILNDLRLDILAACIRGSIYVGNETHSRNLLLYI